MSEVTNDMIEVPDGMRTSVLGNSRANTALCEEIMRLALLWLTQNPMRPSDADIREMDTCGVTNQLNPIWPETAEKIVLWQRRMFLRRTPELPQEVKDLRVVPGDLQFIPVTDNVREVNVRIEKAYALGLKNGGSK